MSRDADDPDVCSASPNSGRTNISKRRSDEVAVGPGTDQYNVGKRYISESRSRRGHCPVPDSLPRRTVVGADGRRPPATRDGRDYWRLGLNFWIIYCLLVYTCAIAALSLRYRSPWELRYPRHRAIPLGIRGIARSRYRRGLTM